MILRVRELVTQRARRVAAAVGMPRCADHLMPGKLLRTRFGAYAGLHTNVDASELAQACAAVELVHTASLCHDDVIDNAFLRRSMPTLWRLLTPSAAVLVGDVLLCNALSLIAACAEGQYIDSFLEKVNEVCTVEAEQELVLRGAPVRPDECLRVARGKTGPLFAFVGMVAAGDDADLAYALAEAGYRIGTAYQLADDLLDVTGCDEVAGKTLGTDAIRRKFTLAEQDQEITGDRIRGLLDRAAEAVSAWPLVRRDVSAFVRCVLTPLLARQAEQPNLGLASGQAT